ncbi:hypothetical protein [Streptomyces spiramyceticus]|uniref:hypothetical protein n=1 Tax=Streptomyces spiramyceticus TaxID=299717 RepID=UPI00237AB81C|nr:hypothetical protein [Streptomyces spiramyceticus]
MGWAVLYIAFGVVALWLLGEVLLQYKARLRWRLLAFAGFVGVVLGVLLSSVLVIGAGAIAFAIGQTYVTLSFRRGFSTGWAIGGKPGESRRRRGGARAVEQEPTLEVSDLEYVSDVEYEPAAPPEPVYAPQPLPDETGQYGVYDAAAYAAEPQPQANAFGGYNEYDTTYTGYDQPSQDVYAGQYGYAPEQQQYAAYSDPYIGTQPYGTQQYGNETPPGGVWVPQQRDGEQQFGGEQPVQDPYQNGYDANRYDANGYDTTGYNTTGYNEQYRY